MAEEKKTRRPRPFIGVLFKCCNVYARLYRTDDGRAYTGGCPRCGRRMKAVVGKEGTSSRFFRTR